MVYCSKCGTKNKEGAKYCSKCGANLEGSLEERFERRAEEVGEQFERRADECFGLPHGGAIVGVVISIIIILAGISQIPGIKTMYAPIQSSDYIGSIAAILFGVLILAGSLYKFSRRY